MRGFFSKMGRFAISKMAAFCYAVAVGVAGNLVVHYMQTHDAVPSIAATHHETPAPADKPAASRPRLPSSKPVCARRSRQNRWPCGTADDVNLPSATAMSPAAAEAGRGAWAARRATHQRTAQHRTVEPCCRIAAARPGDRGRGAARIARRYDRLGADLAIARDKIRARRGRRQTARSGQTGCARSRQRRPVLSRGREAV